MKIIKKTPDNDESNCITDSPMVESVNNNSNNSNSVTDEESVLSDDSDEEDDGLLDGVIMIDPENDSDYTDLLDDVENADDDEVDVIAPIETKKKKSKIKKAFLIILGTILTFVLVLGATLLIMRITGKSSLYGRANSSGPNLTRDEASDGTDNNEIDINLDDMGDMSNIDNSTQNNSSAGDGSGSNNTGTSSNNIVKATDKNAGYDVIYNDEKYAYNEDIITLLVLGIDNTQPVAPAKDGLSGGQSDSIFLVVMNPHTMVMDIIAIPRDTITKLWIYDAQGNFIQTGNAQICLQHGYGDAMEISNERALKAVSYLMYDIPIHSVTSINMGAVGMLNDAIGGVTLESLETFDYAGFSYVQGKTITLKGNMAYEYVHYRDCTRHNTASERLARQRQYISLFIDKALSAVKDDLGTVTDVYNIINDYIVTDLSIDEIVYLASEAISYDFGEFISLEGTLDTSMRYERYYLDEEKLQNLIIKKFYEKVE